MSETSSTETTFFFMSFANRKLTGSLPSLFVSNGALQIPGVSLDSEKHPASRKGGVWRIPGFVDCMIDQGSEKETMAMWWCLGCATLNVNDLYMFFSIWPSKHSLEFVWGTSGKRPLLEKNTIVFQADSNRELYLGAATFTCCSLSPYQRAGALLETDVIPS